ncbi:MAG: diaminopimelate decarboxylase [Candidatus Hydrothermarchaeaceae archaeon]
MDDFRPHLSVNDENHLTIGGVDTVELAEEFGTPLYVIDEARIRGRYREFRDAFKKHYSDVEVKYAYKANTNLAVCHILRQEGCGADVLSQGDIEAALKVGVDPGEMIFTGNNKTDEELRLAVDKGVIINIDAMHELERLIRLCSSMEKNARVSFRINPAVSPNTHPRLATGLKESKFGIHEAEALEAYRDATKSGCLQVVGIHMHIGSQITETSPYVEAVGKLLDLVGLLKRELDLDLEFVDIGGGLGIRYERDKPYITPDQLADAVISVLRDKIEEHDLREPTLFLEPGRYIVGDAALMLARVSTIKKTPYRMFVGVDAGFNTLPRPVVYDAYHEVVLANKAGSEGVEKVDVAGNVCETGDILARDRILPHVEENDLVAFLDAGAYSFIMASQYNLRPRPAEILVNGEEYEVIRERETMEDLYLKQSVPERLLR